MATGLSVDLYLGGDGDKLALTGVGDDNC